MIADTSIFLPLAIYKSFIIIIIIIKYIAKWLI